MMMTRLWIGTKVTGLFVSVICLACLAGRAMADIDPLNPDDDSVQIKTPFAVDVIKNEPSLQARTDSDRLNSTDDPVQTATRYSFNVVKPEPSLTVALPGYQSLAETSSDISSGSNMRVSDILGSMPTYVPPPSPPVITIERTYPMPTSFGPPELPFSAYAGIAVAVAFVLIEFRRWFFRHTPAS